MYNLPTTCPDCGTESIALSEVTGEAYGEPMVFVLCEDDNDHGQLVGL